MASGHVNRTKRPNTWLHRPIIQTAMRVHDEAHGEVAKVRIDSALRAIMFTDIVGSTSMTERLGDARSVEMVRAHDALVRRALKDKGGHVVKHTGDGIMASFADAAASVHPLHPASV